MRRGAAAVRPQHCCCREAVSTTPPSGCALSRADRRRVLHRGRRGPGLPDRLRAGGGAPRRRAANGLRGRGGKRAHWSERRPGSPTRLASGTTRWLRCRNRWRYRARCGARLRASPRGSSLRARRSSPLISICTSAAGPPSRPRRRRGRITVVGTVPDQDLAADLVRWLAPYAEGGGQRRFSTVSTSTDTSTATRLHVCITGAGMRRRLSSGMVTDMLGGERHIRVRRSRSGHGTYGCLAVTKHMTRI